MHSFINEEYNDNFTEINCQPLRPPRDYIYIEIQIRRKRNIIFDFADFA